MILIVGLGNPSAKYELTRHNAGFLAIDYIAKELGLEWSEHKKTKSVIAKSSECILLKPQTFMNLSGESVSAALNFFKIDKSALVVLHDDIDVDLGNLKTTRSSRAAGNNGVQSIIDHLGTQEFFRIRIGVRTPERELRPAEKFVLERFKPDELATIKQLFPEIKKAALD